MKLTEEAREYILKSGYDPLNGARPLRRAVERLLTRPLSGKILEDAFEPDSTIVVTVGEGDKLAFEREEA